MDEPKFPISQVAAAAGLSVATLRSWLQRGHWRLDGGDRAAQEHGASHALTLRRALQIGTAAEAVRMGMEPATAFAAAHDFSDVSSPLEARGFNRDPGELFAAPASTWLVAFSASKRGKIVRVAPNKGLALDDLYDDQTRLWGGVTVWLDKVDHRMRTGLQAE